MLRLPVIPTTRLSPVVNQLVPRCSLLRLAPYELLTVEDLLGPAQLLALSTGAL